MRRKTIYNACQWHSSFREVLPKCTFGIHCWKFCLLYAALCLPLHVEETVVFSPELVGIVGVSPSAAVQVLEQVQKQRFGCCVPLLDSVGAHPSEWFVVYPLIQHVAFFQLD